MNAGPNRGPLGQRGSTSAFVVTRARVQHDAEACAAIVASVNSATWVATPTEPGHLP